ncbi:hypothetical protein RI056_02960 [Komagataeibacter nataicola]|nr:hypothetical protein [Komagataeibacter nataicola]WNM09043.1 hypothetical protein RI056_02960 [Komagataeibacter nataicola]
MGNRTVSPFLATMCAGALHHLYARTPYSRPNGPRPFAPARVKKPARAQAPAFPTRIAARRHPH